MFKVDRFVPVKSPYKAGEIDYVAECQGKRYWIPPAMYGSLEDCDFIKETVQPVEGLYAPGKTFWCPYNPNREELVEWLKENPQYSSQKPQSPAKNQQKQPQSQKERVREKIISRQSKHFRMSLQEKGRKSQKKKHNSETTKKELSKKTT